MSSAEYGTAFGATQRGRLRRFLAAITESIDSLVASRSRNAVLDRDLQQARQDMDRVGRLLDAGGSVYRAELSIVSTTQGRKIYY